MSSSDLVILLAAIVVATWIGIWIGEQKMKTYVAKAAFFVSAPETTEKRYSFTCECGRPLIVEYSLDGRQARSVCPCGNAWRYARKFGEPYMDVCISLFNNGLVAAKFNEPDRLRFRHPLERRLGLTPDTEETPASHS